MTASSQQLPAFKTPPLVEVALSIQFEPLSRLDNAQIARLWITRFFDRFPEAQEKPRLESQVEGFGSQSRQSRKITFELATSPASRWWLISSDGSRLVQIQRDRLIYNWRKVNNGEYPRYGRIREEFHEVLRTFIEFVEVGEVGKVVPSQAELSYFNHIQREGVWGTHDQLDRVVTLWAMDRVVGNVSLVQEDATIAVRYLIPDEAGTPAGRLHVSIEPDFRNEEPIFVMNLVARGMFGGAGAAGSFQFLDLAHLHIVRTFVAITTPRMHQVWRLHGSL